MVTYARQLLLSGVLLAAGLSGASSQGGAFADGGSRARNDVEVAKTATPWVKISGFPQTAAGLGEVSCASSTCVAVGTIDGMSLVVSHDGGRSWSTPAVPTGVTTLESVSCASGLQCVAVGEYLQPGPTDERPGVVVVTSDGGRSWARQTTTAAGSLDAVSCASTRDCVAIGSVDQNGNVGENFALATTTGGRDWVRAPIAGSQSNLYGLSCPSPRTCVAVGSDTSAANAGTPVVMVTTDGGARWRAAAVPSDDVGLYSVSCPTEVHCAAIGSEQPPSSAVVAKPVQVVFTSTDGGQRWVGQRPLPGSGDYAGSVSCTASGWCLATGANVPLLSRDYGQNWTSERPSAGFSTNVASVACPTAGDCVAVGGAEGPSNGAYSFPFTYPTMATSTDGGRDWEARRPPEGWSVDAMACPGRQICVAAGTTNAGTAGAWATSDFGRTWEEAALPRTLQILNSVSCPSPTTCAAVGSTVGGTAVAFTSTDGGTSWASSVVPQGLASLASVSCANIRLCVAVGSLAVRFSVPPGGHIGVADIESGSGALLTSDDGGRTWANRTLSATHAGYVPYFFSVSCLPDGFCATGPSYGRFLSSANGGRSWADVKNSSGFFPSTGLSCTGPSDCAASGTLQASSPQLSWTDDGGGSWSKAAITSAPTQYAESTWQLGAPTCSAGSCLVVGGDIWYGSPALALVSRDEGRSWAVTKLPPTSSLITAASCTAAFACLAASETQSGRGMFIAANLGSAN